jgi:hypothetical protein
LDAVTVEAFAGDAQNVAQLTTNGLVLAKGWRVAMKERDPVELERLLRDIGHSEVDLSPNPGIVIYKTIRYLEHIDKALEIVGKNMTAKVKVPYPAFPRDSFFYYPVDGNFSVESCDACFNRLLILTDLANQVVGVELVDEAPQTNVHKGDDRTYKVYDFLQNGAKATPSWSVNHCVVTGSQMVKIDSSTKGTRFRRGDTIGATGNGTVAIYSELVDDSGKLRERTLLILPLPVANLVVFHVQKHLQ